MKRIALFLLTNIAIMLVLTVILQLFGVTSLLAANGVDLDIPSLLIFAAVFGMGGSLISLAMSKFMAKRMTGAQVIEQPSNAMESWLVSTVTRQARQAGIGMPEVAIYDSPDMNAFATGMSRNSALVAVSTGLLRQMSQDEAEAVIGHEVSHIANGDMVTLSLIQGVVNTFVFFFAHVIGHIVDRMVLRNERGHGIGYFVTVIFAEMVLGVLASMIVFWFSRRREFAADAGGAHLAGRTKMIGALRRLQAGSIATELPDQMQALGISGKKALGIKRYFMTHPPLEERIAALEGAKAQRA